VKRLEKEGRGEKGRVKKGVKVKYSCYLVIWQLPKRRQTSYKPLAFWIADWQVLYHPSEELWSCWGKPGD